LKVIYGVGRRQRRIETSGDLEGVPVNSGWTISLTPALDGFDQTKTFARQAAWRAVSAMPELPVNRRRSIIGISLLLAAATLFPVSRRRDSSV
jgi:hypothetical protein